MLPAAASSIAARPDAFYGQYVSVYATVERELSPTAFALDQDKTRSTGQEVLVVAPRLHEPVPLNEYVTVIGEVVRPDSAEIEKRLTAGAQGLPPDILSKYPGRPVIVATAVINPALVDLARFIPPPMTPEEAAFDKTMKGVGGANGALRKGVDASNAELVKTNTAILLKAFADVEAFWKGRGKADAVKLAQTARGAVQAIETAAGMGNWNEAKSQAATLAQQCQSCHGAYRERGEDGSFFIRPGG
jgi:cytochrome c556